MDDLTHRIARRHLRAQASNPMVKRMEKKCLDARGAVKSVLKELERRDLTQGKWAGPAYRDLALLDTALDRVVGHKSKHVWPLIL